MIGKGQTVGCGQVLQEGKPQPLDIQIADVACQMDEAEQAHTYNIGKDFGTVKKGTENQTPEQQFLGDGSQDHGHQNDHGLILQQHQVNAKVIDIVVVRVQLPHKIGYQLSQVHSAQNGQKGITQNGPNAPAGLPEGLEQILAEDQHHRSNVGQGKDQIHFDDIQGFRQEILQKAQDIGKQKLIKDQVSNAPKNGLFGRLGGFCQRNSHSICFSLYSSFMASMGVRVSTDSFSRAAMTCWPVRSIMDT